MNPSGNSAQPCRSAVGLIATHGRPDLLKESLESLGACTDPGVPFEIVVVENGGQHGARELCASLSLRYPVRYIYVPEAGKSHALNLALEQLDADLAIMFDDDMDLQPGTLAAYVQTANRYGPGHFFGGPVDPRYQAEPEPWLRAALPASAAGWSLGDAEQTIDKPDFIGVNWAAFIADLQAVGGFDTRRGPNAGFRTIGQETEMQQRLLAAGQIGVYVPGARVTHYVPVSRCTVEWALDRRYRTWLTFTLSRSRRDKQPSLAGVPLWLWRQAAGSWGRMALGRLLRRPWPRRIAGEMRWAEDKGSIRAFRLEAGGLNWAQSSSSTG